MDREDINFYVGSEIPSYFEDENGNITPYTQTSYYPVYNGNETVGVFYVYHGDDNDTYCYSETLGSELNTCLNYSDSAILLNDNEERVVSNTTTNIASLSAERSMVLTPVEVNFAASTVLTETDTSANFISVPKWNQHVNGIYYGLCWAGSMWSIGEYVVGSTFNSPFDIADELGVNYYNGVYCSDMVELFDDLYGLTVVYKGSITHNTIMTNIDDGEPIYMDFQTTGLGHATVLCGYADNGTNFVLWIMDPFDGTYKTISVPTSSSTYALNVNGSTYTWKHSLVIK